MYQYNDRLTQLFTNINIFGLGYNVSTPYWVPVRGQNIVTKAKYIYIGKELC
jgi:hypothetical protein